MDSAIPFRTVVCPSCQGPSRYATDNPFRPFCSERCRSLDFGAWASESFRVGADPDDESLDQDPADGQPPH